MQFLPLFHKLQGRLVLVIGGGEVALRKARLLSDAGAVLRVVAPDIRSELQALAGPGGIFLRGYMVDFIHRFAPHLSRDAIGEIAEITEPEARQRRVAELVAKLQAC